MFRDMINNFAKYGEKTAVIYKEKEITYEQLLKYVKNFGSYLSEKDKRPVIIYSDKCIEYLIGMISCIYAGRTYIPVGKNVPYERLISIVGLSDASDIITDEKIPIKTIGINDVCTKFLSQNSNQSFTTEPVYTMFTSGTTGVPKGVPISSDNLENFLYWLTHNKYFCDEKNTVVLNCAEFCFDLSVADVFYSLCTGKTLVLLEKGQNVCDAINRFGIDTAVMTPTFLKGCLIDKAFCADICPTLKTVFLCGEIFEKSTALRMKKVFPNCEMINAYGPTEATCAVCAVRITDDMLLSEKSLPVGEVNNAAVDVIIKNGEIILEGKSVFSGYVGGNKTITRYYTGDMGDIFDGLLYFRGRIDSQIKYKGYRIELCDIEENIMKIESVSDCAVIAKKNGDKVIAIQAFIVSENQDVQYYRSQLQKLLPEYMIPKKIIFIPCIPVNENGKKDRKTLEVNYE